MTEEEKGNGESKHVDDLMQDLKDEEERDKELLGPLFEDGGEVVLDKCPGCGSADRVFSALYDYFVRHGKMKAGKVPCSNVSMLQYSDGGLGLFVGAKVPTFTIFRDVCRSCGMEYPIKIVRQDQQDMTTIRRTGQQPQR